MKELNVFFNPKSVAIIGASDSFKFGYATTKYLLESEFKTYPINIKKQEIHGHKTYKNIKDIPEEIELAILLVGNEHVLQAVKDCVEKGVKGIIIESAGFSETGVEKYIRIQNEIEKIAQETQVRIIGPNCIGVTDFNNKFSSADMDFDKAVKGKIAVIAQSGVLGNIFIDWAHDKGIGFSKTITIGNKVDVDEVDLLNYLNKDPKTKIITLYLEGTKRGKDFISTLKNMEKPVLILKNGKSEIGSKAVNSHTGSIAGNNKIYEAVIKQNPRVFRVNNFYEMFNIAHVFATQPIPKGKNVAIITGSGSLGALACDEIEKQNLNLASLSENTISLIKSVIPNWVSIRGTIDLGPSIFQTFDKTANAIFRDKNVDCILYIFSVPRWPLQMMGSMATQWAIQQFDLIKELTKNFNKPCVCVCYGSRWTFEFLRKAASSSNSEVKIPIMSRIKHAMKAFKMMYEFGKMK
ncbi:MAG: acetyl-CoA synthetase [Promethearchaeota archaeon Loki_b32]|nr:MAG: acetyl-CoA synthetase [Candidatus Lokiarchaeota archaeon Loki_b32]